LFGLRHCLAWDEADAPQPVDRYAEEQNVRKTRDDDNKWEREGPRPSQLTEKP